MLRYRNLDIQAPDYEPLSYYSSDTDQDLAAWLANLGTGTAAGAEGAAHEVPERRRGASTSSSGGTGPGRPA